MTRIPVAEPDTLDALTSSILAGDPFVVVALVVAGIVAAAIGASYMAG